MNLFPMLILGECVQTEANYYRRLIVPGIKNEFQGYLMGMLRFWDKVAAALFEIREEHTTHASAQEFGRMLVRMRLDVFECETKLAPSGFKWPIRAPWSIVANALVEEFPRPQPRDDDDDED